LNRKTNQYILEISGQSGQRNLKLKINTETPTLNEIKTPLKQTKNGRALGVNNIKEIELSAVNGDVSHCFQSQERYLQDLY
jgi:hypothetical protein